MADVVVSIFFSNPVHIVRSLSGEKALITIEAKAEELSYHFRTGKEFLRALVCSIT